MVVNFAIVIGVVLLICVVLYLVGTADDRRARREYKQQHKVLPEDKKELEALRTLRDDLLDWSLDNMDVEPQARIVYDMIRANEKKELGR